MDVYRESHLTQRLLGDQLQVELGDVVLLFPTVWDRPKLFREAYPETPALAGLTCHVSHPVCGPRVAGLAAEEPVIGAWPRGVTMTHSPDCMDGAPCA